MDLTLSGRQPEVSFSLQCGYLALKKNDNSMNK